MIWVNFYPFPTKGLYHQHTLYTPPWHSDFTKIRATAMTVLTSIKEPTKLLPREDALN